MSISGINTQAFTTYKKKMRHASCKGTLPTQQLTDYSYHPSSEGELIPFEVVFGKGAGAGEWPRNSEKTEVMQKWDGMSQWG